MYDVQECVWPQSKILKKFLCLLQQHWEQSLKLATLFSFVKKLGSPNRFSSPLIITTLSTKGFLTITVVLPF